MTDSYDLLTEAVDEFETGTRQGQAALLAWFLANVFRMEPEDVDDALCDGPGDKGIDGLVVDESGGDITVLQGKWRTSKSKTQGDGDLKQLVGAAGYFETPENFDALMASSPNPELHNLLVRQQVREKIAAGTHKVRLVFVTNAKLDTAGRDYVSARATSEPVLDVWDRMRLSEVVDRVRRPELRPETITLTASARPTHIKLTDAEQMAVAVVPASQLVDLPGIDDLTLFSRNVRLFAGATRINRQLRDTIQDSDEHRLFPAYHNGLTILTSGLNISGNRLTLDEVGVVNGCQSLVTLHANRTALSTELKLLVKVVEVTKASDVADLITYRSNNQNAVTMRDQRSGDPVMRDLQQQVTARFGRRLALQIRLGETLVADEILDNTLAAQLITAVYLGEPWAAVRKVRLFDHDFRRIWDRSVTADRLYLLSLLDRAVRGARRSLREDLRASFASVRFTLNHLLAAVLRLSTPGSELLDTPDRWLVEQEPEIRASLEALVEDVVESVNFYVEASKEDDENFDSKVEFKSQRGVMKLEHEVLGHARRQSRRDGSYLFAVAPADRDSPRRAAKRVKKSTAPTKRTPSSGKSATAKTPSRARKRPQ